MDEEDEIEEVAMIGQLANAWADYELIQAAHRIADDGYAHADRAYADARAARGEAARLRAEVARLRAELAAERAARIEAEDLLLLASERLG